MRVNSSTGNFNRFWNVRLRHLGIKEIKDTKPINGCSAIIVLRESIMDRHGMHGNRMMNCAEFRRFKHPLVIPIKVISNGFKHAFNPVTKGDIKREAGNLSTLNKLKNGVSNEALHYNQWSILKFYQFHFGVILLFFWCTLLFYVVMLFHRRSIPSFVYYLAHKSFIRFQPFSRIYKR